MVLQCTLTPSEGKRLIGQAVASLESVRTALDNGIIVVATGTTNAYVVEELIGKRIKNKGLFTVGVVTAKGCCVTNPHKRHDHCIIDHGTVVEMKTVDLPKILSRMESNDVFIKGANAIDPFGSAAVLLGGLGGGTIGASWGHIAEKGIKFIIPVGLEKLVPFNLSSVILKTGKRSVDKTLGAAVGMMIVHGEIITELEAFQTLAGVKAFPIGGGGINGGEGAKIFVLEGTDTSLKIAWNLLKRIKGEPQLTTETLHCNQCNINCDYR